MVRARRLVGTGVMAALLAAVLPAAGARAQQSADLDRRLMLDPAALDAQPDTFRGPAGRAGLQPRATGDPWGASGFSLQLKDLTGIAKPDAQAGRGRLGAADAPPADASTVLDQRVKLGTFSLGVETEGGTRLRTYTGEEVSRDDANLQQTRARRVVPFIGLSVKSILD